MCVLACNFALHITQVQGTVHSQIAIDSDVAEAHWYRDQLILAQIPVEMGLQGAENPKTGYEAVASPPYMHRALTGRH